jgi:hypothetical protein
VKYPFFFCLNLTELKCIDILVELLSIRFHTNLNDSSIILSIQMDGIESFNRNYTGLQMHLIMTKIETDNLCNAGFKTLHQKGIYLLF